MSGKSPLFYSTHRTYLDLLSEHPPVRGENVKTFRWDNNRLQTQNLSCTKASFPFNLSCVIIETKSNQKFIRVVVVVVVIPYAVCVGTYLSIHR